MNPAGSLILSVDEAVSLPSVPESLHRTGRPKLNRPRLTQDNSLTLEIDIQRYGSRVGLYRAQGQTCGDYLASDETFEVFRYDGKHYALGLSAYGVPVEFKGRLDEGLTSLAKSLSKSDGRPIKISPISMPKKRPQKAQST